MIIGQYLSGGVLALQLTINQHPPRATTIVPLPLFHQSFPKIFRDPSPQPRKGGTDRFALWPIGRHSRVTSHHDRRTCAPGSTSGVWWDVLEPRTSGRSQSSPPAAPLSSPRITAANSISTQKRRMRRERTVYSSTWPESRDGWHSRV